MAVNETLQPLSGGQLAPDPNVRVPDHVKAASAAADAIHQQFYPKDPAQAEAPAKEALPQPPAPEPLHTQAAAPEPAPDPQAPAVDPQAPRPGDENVSEESWRHRFLSMQGRYNASVREKAGMEEQMRQLGQELVRTQNLLSQVQTPSPQTANPDSGHANLITEEDRQNYGEELIGLASRVARATVAPEIESLRAENQRLTAAVKTTGRRELFSALDIAVPNWRAINRDPRFLGWLRLPNVYTGQIRGTMLKAAVDGAEAPRAIAFFKDFLSEATATGLMAPAPQVEQQPAPHTPALSLETLAAPGRARPASGDSQVPTAKPFYSRADIRQFYDESRKGLWAGREAEYRAKEADLQLAQSEGRIR